MRISLAALAFLTLPLAAADPKKDGPANRLAKESSPYLLQHAHNPVDWYPWGPEAFEKAKKEGKLVFLSIGYSTCHWCHVMERESFEDAEVAKILNDHFVCIKVDREERPDIDDIYMTSLSVLDARGGWPLSMFLTDEGKPIIGGTYWPKEDRKVGDKTARGFKSILLYMVELNRDKGKELRAQADVVAERTAEAMTRMARGIAIVELNRSLARGPVEELRERLDPKYGGLAAPPRFAGPKFPSPPSLTALFRAARRNNDKELADLVTLTLTKMAEGGIYDHLAGGFHRYSTDRTWTVPHFEKMLYDNAQLVELYAEAYQSDPKPVYQRVVDETVRFVLREMTSPEGGFYSAIDADSEGKEGESYVWTAAEIDKVLGAQDAAVFRAVYGVTGPPTFEDRAYVLQMTRPLADVAKDQKLSEAELQNRLAASRAKLLAVRDKRPRPFLDTKVLTAWNGQIIAGLAVAGQTFRQTDYTKAAVRAADFLLANVRTMDGRLMRSYSRKSDGKSEAKLNAYLEDYSFLINGLLCLHDATGEARWLNEAKALTETMVKWHGDGDRGGYFFTSSDHEKLFARPKDYHDGVQPSGNSVAARNLVRLWQKTGDERYRQLAEKTLKQFAGIMKGMPSASPGMGEALHAYLDVAGKKDEPKPAEKKEAGKPRSSADVVSATADLGQRGNDGNRAVTVTIKIESPWHIYANPTGHDDLEPARTTVDVYAAGTKLPAKFQYPKGKAEKDDKGMEYRTYEGEVVIKGMVLAKDATDIEVRVKLMACTTGEDGRCLAAATLKLPVK
ncbi:MAG: thioredoxin domain-containing protein [Zavarzinella sp.]|nr:thioredoxin domain-containing protein [Zavarzinella sp.]